MTPPPRMPHAEAMASNDAASPAARAARLRAAGDRDALLALAARHPDDPAVAYQTAWLLDTLGREAEAVDFYRAALAAEGLPPADRLGAHTGLGSTYRVLGRYDDALAAFDRALAEHPADPALTAFRAIALHNLGRSGEAVSDLLKLLTRTSDEAGIARYRRALEHYADRLDETVLP
jgi:tetratricopeptide (TPR) repeat protein